MEQKEEHTTHVTRDDVRYPVATFKRWNPLGESITFEDDPEHVFCDNIVARQALELAAEESREHGATFVVYAPTEYSCTIAFGLIAGWTVFLRQGTLLTFQRVVFCAQPKVHKTLDKNRLLPDDFYVVKASAVASWNGLPEPTAEPKVVSLDDFAPSPPTERPGQTVAPIAAAAPSRPKPPARKKRKGNRSAPASSAHR